MTSEVFLELENYEYAFIKTFFLRFSIEALSVFSANTYASYVEVTFYRHAVRCLWDFQSIFAFKIP